MKEANDTPDSLTERLSRYADTKAAREWLEENSKRVRELFSNATLRDFVFEPIKGVFELKGDGPEHEIRQAITMVAVANAVMAGLPGKMGVGVLVSMGLEGWMAYVIASRVGIKLETPSDVWKYFGLLGTVGATIFFAFRALLGLAFSLFSPIPGLNPMIPAEMLVTDFVGVVFWVGFEEARTTGGFSVPLRALGRLGDETKSLAQFQWGVISDNLNPAALGRIGTRLKAWFMGEIPAERSELRGDIATAAMMAYLLGGRYGELSGPLGQEFIQSIRDRFPELAHAGIGEIADHMREYDAVQMAGVINEIKGKLFERLVAAELNHGDPHWKAVLHSDESFPGSDITLTNTATGETVELSLKATDSPSYIEHALLQYPDIKIISTEEVAQLFHDDPRVAPDGVTNRELTTVTKENFDQMLSHLSLGEIAGGIAEGAAVRVSIGLWPFVAAYMHDRITQEQLTEACKKALGDAGVSLASRLSYAAVLGPLFAWYLLARGVMGLTRAAQKAPSERSIHRLTVKSSVIAG